MTQSPNFSINPSLDTNAETARVLIVASDPIVCDSLSRTLTGEGYDTATAYSADEAIDAVAESEQACPTKPARPFQVILTDITLPGKSGLDLLRILRETYADIVVVIVTAYGTIPSAVKAIKLGATDYITYPVVEEELSIIVEKAARQGALVATCSSLRRQLDSRYGLGNIIGQDPRMAKIYDLIESVAPTNTTVLMTGESGTGKSMIAKTIHRQSSVADGPFVEISCGSIPETLLESELFGHVKGAFTGAHADKQGRFLAANEGTIFLDEINSASAGMQLKLLRVLQEKRFEPVGSNETVEVDVRVLLATNQPLEQLVTEGTFRQDLYYRINVVAIDLPPLRDRSGDIPLLAEFFLEQYCRQHDRRIAGFTDEALAAMQAYDMPGNVRELENIVQRAVVLSRRGMIDIEDLSEHVIQNQSLRLQAGGEHDSARANNAGAESLWSGEPLAEALEQQERHILMAALDANEWNRQQTADQLDINRTTLYKKIKHYNLDRWPAAG